MNDPLAFVKVKALTADEVAPDAGLSDEALLLLAPQQTPREYLDAILAQEHFTDAVKFLAHALPRREGVWWAALCLQSAVGEAPPANIAAVLKAAVRWVLEPNEEHRRQAAALADKNKAEDFLCRAVAWTGGSLTPPELPVVPPKPGMSPTAVAASVQLATQIGPSKGIRERKRHFLALGVRIARGMYTAWSEQEPAPEPRARPQVPPSRQAGSSGVRRPGPPHPPRRY